MEIASGDDGGPGGTPLTAGFAFPVQQHPAQQHRLSLITEDKPHTSYETAARGPAFDDLGAAALPDAPLATAPPAPTEPTSPHKRQLTSSSDDEQQRDSGPTPKRAATPTKETRLAAPGCSSSQGVLASVFAQPHVQATLPVADMPSADVMLPPRPQQQPNAQPQRPEGLRRSSSGPSGQQEQDEQQEGQQEAQQQQQQPHLHQLFSNPSLQHMVDRRQALHSSVSSGSLPSVNIEGMPSTSSLQGWLVNGGAAFGGSPLKRNVGTEGSGSFRKWIRSENSCGSFTLPTMLHTSGTQASLELEDSLSMDIQLLPPVVPEEVPAGESGEEAMAAAEQRQSERRQQWVLEQQRQQDLGFQAAAVAASERAFHAKIAGWEDELLGMLQAQMAPITIRAVVQAFKDRIYTERDKTEFKALCDKYTVVVEFPVASGVKCLALKAWLQMSDN